VLNPNHAKRYSIHLSIRSFGRHFVIVTWNLSPTAIAKYRRADVLVMSVGKSGRTWLRVLVNKYLSLHYGVPFSLDDLHADNRVIPALLYDHEMWSHYSDASWLYRLIGSNIVPEGILRTKKVVLLYRDPRDVVVSMYFHKTKRSRRKMQIDISSFVRDRRYGICNVVRVMNLWRTRLADHPACLWLCYEGMKADPAGQLHRLLEFSGVPGVREELIREAVAFADFENMKRMEAGNEFGTRILRARDASDPDSFKVREGKVGGFAKHFSPADLEYLSRCLASLDTSYGYRPG
jgi:hypothetical protein